MHKSAVVLLSGGLDSAVALAVAQDDGYCCHTLSFDYGQRNKAELEAARRISSARNAVAHHVAFFRLASSVELPPASALTDNVAVPVDRQQLPLSSERQNTYVPARNLIFFAHALGLAERLDADAVVIGATAPSTISPPDIREDFLAVVEQAGALGTWRGREGRPIRLIAPLTPYAKADVVRIGFGLFVPFHLTLSCYGPVGPDACGRCDPCQLRRQAFADANISDPTRYA